MKTFAYQVGLVVDNVRQRAIVDDVGAVGRWPIGPLPGSYDVRAAADNRPGRANMTLILFQPVFNFDDRLPFRVHFQSPGCNSLLFEI